VKWKRSTRQLAAPFLLSLSRSPTFPLTSSPGLCLHDPRLLIATTPSLKPHTYNSLQSLYCLYQDYQTSRRNCLLPSLPVLRFYSPSGPSRMAENSDYYQSLVGL
jgi:hypothetical protein